MPEPLLRFRDVCEWLFISRPTLYRLIARGELTPTYVGGRPRFTREDIEAYLATHRRRDA